MSRTYRKVLRTHTKFKGTVYHGWEDRCVKTPRARKYSKEDYREEFKDELTFPFCVGGEQIGLSTLWSGQGFREENIVGDVDNHYWTPPKDIRRMVSKINRNRAKVALRRILRDPEEEFDGWPLPFSTKDNWY